MGMRGPDTTVKGHPHLTILPVIGLEYMLNPKKYALNCHIIFKNFLIPDFLYIFCHQVKSYLFFLTYPLIKIQLTNLNQF